METTINQRFKYACNELGYTQKDLTELLNTQQSSISKMLNGVYPIGKNMLFRIKEALGISPQWLQYGIGDMIENRVDNRISNVSINGNGNNGNVMVANNVFGNTTQINGTTPTTTQPQPNHNPTLTDAVEEVDAEVIPYVDTALARKRNFNIAKAINNDSELLKQRTLDELFSPISFIIKMYDNSMSDEIRQGDMLFAKFIPKEANIVSGKIYLIDTNSYGTLVRQVYVNEDSFTLHAFNPSYEDIIITRDDIFNFCIVEHSLRSSFLIPDNTISTIAAESAKQVTKALSMLEKANERNEKLMELILNKL